MLSTAQSLSVMGLLVFSSVFVSYMYGRYITDTKKQPRDGSAVVIMKRSMGLFLVLVVLPKLLNIRSFSLAFSHYDLIARRIPIYAYLEMALGVAWWHNADTMESSSSSVPQELIDANVICCVSSSTTVMRLSKKAIPSTLRSDLRI